MTGMLRLPRRRGALSGALLVLLGIWGGLIPFIGPYFHYAFSPDRAWAYTSGRFWLEILPALGTLVGGLIVVASALRPVAILGAWLAAISGAWFAIGGSLATLWTAGSEPAQGVPVGGTLARAMEQIGFFTGLAAVVLFVAAVALGRFSVVAVRDVRIAARQKPAKSQVTTGMAAGKWWRPRASAEEPTADDQAADDRPAREPANVGTKSR